MALNFKCDFDIDGLNLMPETKRFLRKVASKDPKLRYDSDQALEDEIFMRMELDEFNSRVNTLSMNYKRGNSRKTEGKANLNFVNKYVEGMNASPIHSALLVNANFRMDYSQKSDFSGSMPFLKTTLSGINAGKNDKTAPFNYDSNCDTPLTALKINNSKGMKPFKSAKCVEGEKSNYKKFTEEKFKSMNLQKLALVDYNECNVDCSSDEGNPLSGWIPNYGGDDE